MQATANARGRRIAGQLLTGRAVEKRRSSNSDARPSTCISSKVAPSSPSIARYKLNEAEAIRRAQGGDQLMFEHLYRLHSRRVFWSKNSSCPLPYARTSLQAQVHDKSGALDPLLGSVCTHPVCEIATHDPLSLPLRLRRLPLVVRASGRPLQKLRMKSSGVCVLSCSAFRGSDRFTAAVSIRQRQVS
jgi:hypothetical protein